MISTSRSAPGGAGRTKFLFQHRCGCSLTPNQFLSLVEGFAGKADDRSWTTARPITHPLHWTCGAAVFQKSILADDQRLAPASASTDGSSSGPSGTLAIREGRPHDGAGGAALVLRHGRIFTADRALPWCEALAIEDGLVLAAGSAAEVEALIGSRTTVVDLDGRLVIPGFNDAHMHHTPDPVGIRLPIDPVADPGYSAIEPLIAQAVAASPPGTWIYGVMGMGLINDRGLDRRRLDRAAPDHPLILLGLTNHTNVLNSAALALLGIGEDTPDPLGGCFERLPNSSQPSGRINEYAQWAPQRTFASMASVAEGVASLKDLSEECLGFGITTLQNMSWTPADRYVAMLREAELPIKVRVIRFPPSGPGGRMLSEGRELPERPGLRISVSGTKWILDGTTVERAAAMGRPYADSPDTHGKMNFSQAEIREMMRESIRLGDPLLLHAIGAEAVSEFLEAAASFGEAIRSGALVLRLEHGDGLSPEQLEEVRELGVTVVQNPTHFLFPEIYGPRFGANSSFALFRSLFANGISVALGSDGPLNPFLGLLAAVAHPARPIEATTLEEALIAYTAGSAAAEGKAEFKGRLMPGCEADLAVLSQDIFALTPDNLPATRSVLTVVDGAIVYRGPGT